MLIGLFIPSATFAVEEITGRFSGGGLRTLTGCYLPAVDRIMPAGQPDVPMGGKFPRQLDSSKLEFFWLLSMIATLGL